jgi:cAMP-binding proteins - catabolite gene activator and regulatory subunit of cAMP-dependent protein kinases
MIDKHMLKLRARDDISEPEERALRAAVSEYRDVPADMTIVREGQLLSVSLLLIEGLMCRYKDLRDGQRQITELHVAGDFADLHSFTLKRLDHNILTMTPCRLAIVPHAALTEITELHPHLTRVLWFSTNLDAAIHREWELSLGRRSAAARAAHLFCELHARLGIVELANGNDFELPLTQIDLAECLGLTPVHVNRTLKELRENGLVSFRSGQVSIKNLSGLQKLAEFNPSYLYLDKIAR